MDNFIVQYQILIVAIVISIAAVTTKYRTTPWKNILGRASVVGAGILWLGALAFWGLLGCLWIRIIMLAEPGVLFEQFHAEANITSFFTRNQVTLLALVVALAAYTSSIEQKLRETIGKRKALGRDFSSHEVNLHWMFRTDIILVLTGLVLVVRIGRWALGYPEKLADQVIIGLLGWAITYFAANHIRQMLIAGFRNWSYLLGPASDEADEDGKDIAEEVVKLIKDKKILPKTARAAIGKVARQFE